MVYSYTFERRKGGIAERIYIMVIRFMSFKNSLYKLITNKIFLATFLHLEYQSNTEG